MNINNSSNNLSSEDSIGKATGFFLFRNVINSYNNDKTKPDEDRKTIKKYGRISLTLSIIALFLSLSCLISNLVNLEFVGYSYVLMLIIYILAGIIVSILFAIYGFVFGVMQIRLNRKSIGIIGLVLSILAFITGISLIVFLII